MNPKKQRPEYEALVDRIVSGELTRAKAATIAQEQTGLSAQTFLGWITANKHIREKLKPTRGSAGSNSVHAHTDPDKVKAYADALSAALAVTSSKNGSVRQVAKKYGVSYEYLRRLLAREVERLATEKPDTLAMRNDQTVEALRRELGEVAPQ